MIFALSGAVAGVGGTLLVINTQNANPALFNYQFSLVFVVVVLTTGVMTVEGAIQGGIAFVVIQQLLTYVPLRFQGLTVVVFALGALTYARHPEGIVEFIKRKQTLQIQRLLFGDGTETDRYGLPRTLRPSSRDGVSAEQVAAVSAGTTSAGSSHLDTEHG